MTQKSAETETPPRPQNQGRILAKTIVLTGMMGSGKSSIGRKLASRLALPFTDSDQEIEAAAGCTVQQFFERFGEDEFRAGEHRVIGRLLEQPMMVLSIGGGAFINDATRALIQERAVSVWLKVDPAILIKRIGRRTGRPVLQRYAAPAEGIVKVLAEREPVYAQAHVTVTGGERPIEDTVADVVRGVVDFAARHGAGDAKYLVIA
mgnify:CR=1 FL=1